MSLPSAATQNTMQLTPLAPPAGGLKGGRGPMLPLRAVPGQTPWAKARPPGTRHRAPPAGLAP